MREGTEKEIIKDGFNGGFLNFLHSKFIASGKDSSKLGVILQLKSAKTI